MRRWIIAPVAALSPMDRVGRARTHCVWALLVAAAVAGCERGPASHAPLLPELRDMVLVPEDPTDPSVAGRAFFADRFEVTDGEYFQLLKASGYRPADTTSFLRHWPRDASGEPVLPEERRDYPVRWVNFDDAQAYARFYGKRLPTAGEWARCARPSRDARYPWHDHFHRAFCNVLSTGIGGPTAVGTFEEGRSPPGCYDIVGNVWEWTTTRADERSHQPVYLIRGGSFADPAGRALENDFARVDDRPPPPPQRSEAATNRNAALGFRCVLDARDFILQALARLETCDDARRDRGIDELVRYGDPLWNLVGRLDFESGERHLWKVGVDSETELVGLADSGEPGGARVLLLGRNGELVVLRGRDGELQGRLDVARLVNEALSDGGQARRTGRLRFVESRLLRRDDGLLLVLSWQLSRTPFEALSWWEDPTPSGMAGVLVIDADRASREAFVARPGSRCSFVPLPGGQQLLVLVSDPPAEAAEEALLFGPIPGPGDVRLYGPPARAAAELVVVEERGGRMVDALRLSAGDVGSLTPLVEPVALLRDAADGWLVVEVTPSGRIRSRRATWLASRDAVFALPVPEARGTLHVAVVEASSDSAAIVRWGWESGSRERIAEIEGFRLADVAQVAPCAGLAPPGVMLSSSAGETLVVQPQSGRVVFRRRLGSVPKVVRSGPGEGSWATYKDFGGIGLLSLITGRVVQRVTAAVVDHEGGDLNGDGELDLCVVTRGEPEVVAVSLGSDRSVRGRLLKRFLDQREDREMPR
ncbi:MAG: SUMF1/EgtB/PvdO family nonheme iron enzyme [Planctomycetota bacterium]